MKSLLNLKENKMGEVIENYEGKLLKQLEDISTSMSQRLAAGEKTITDAEGVVTSLSEKLDEVTKKIGEMEQNMKSREWADMPGVDAGKEKFSIFKAMNAIASKDFSQAGYEKEVMDGARQKAAQAAGNDILGGYLVPLQALGGIVDVLKANIVMASLGATVLDGLVGVPVEIPKQTSSSTAFWVEENAGLTESNINFGQIQMNPKGLGALVKMSNRSLRLANPSLEGLVRQDILEQIALAVDLAAISGTGVNGQPIGILNTAGVGSVDMGATATAAVNPSWEGLYDVEGIVEDANALKGTLGWAMHPASKRALAKLRYDRATAADQLGEFVSTKPMTDAQISAVLGHPFQTTTQIGNTAGATNQLIFGNWADLLIGMWGGMRLLASQEASTAFVNDQTWVRAIMDMDVVVRRTESFAIANNFRNDGAAVTV
jgi:HK97 family phage major capsid protein